MIISIIIIPLSIIFFYLSLKGLGFIFSKLILLKNSQSEIIYPIISFPLIFIFTTILHFFVKLNPYINLSVIFVGFLIYIFKLKKNESFLIFFALLFIVSIQFIGHDVNEDYGYYHLPYIINFISDKLILGLSHLSMVQGYNSAWLNVSSFFYLPFVLENSVHFVNSLIFFSILIYYINFLLNKKKTFEFPISSIYASLVSFFLIIKYSRLNSFGVDVPGHIYASLVFFLFLNFYEKKDYNFRKSTFKLISLFSIFCILIKLSYIPLVFFPMICLFLEKNLLENKFFLILFIFGISWVIQQIAYTSCIIFPLEFTCFEILPWYSKTFINDAAFSLEYINKSYWVYEGSLSESEYIKNFNWVKTWLSRNLVELSENLIVFIFPIILLIFLSLNPNKNNKKKAFNKLFFIMSIPIICGLIIWFLKAPVIRYGIFYINSIIFLIFFFLFKERLFQNFNKNFILVILIISISFNVIKNLNRIFNLKIYEEFPFPKILNIIYETKKYNGLSLNSPIVQDDNQGSVCWNTPIYCRAGKFENLKINKKNGYLIITEK